MSYRPAVRACAAAALAIVIGAAAAAPAYADEGAVASAEVLGAMQRDLGLTAQQAMTRVAVEQEAALLQERLAGELGSGYAGSWLAEDGSLVVATTDAESAEVVSAAGATPQMRSAQADPNAALEALNAASSAQGRGAGPAVPEGVGAWYVDEAAGVVVIEATDVAAGEQFALAAGDPSLVRVQQVAETPQTFANLVGGDAIYAAAGGRCSIGFSGRSGSTTFVITAGHCTEIGGNWQGTNRTLIGPVAGVNFPGDDFGSIRVTNTAGWTPTSQVRGTSSVLGSTVAAIGASTCRSGSTTGYRCGTIQARNATVNYGGGDIVYGLTRTNACAEPGDSGGSFVAGRQAQGMTSGGSGNCSSGGTTFFQPVNEALSVYGLTLVVG